MPDPLANLERKDALDEKIIKKRNIPAIITFWLVVAALLFAFYKAFSGHFSH